MNYSDRFEIIDESKSNEYGNVIYSTNDYSEIMKHWQNITENGNPEEIEWEGDLKLIEVLAIHK